MYGQVSCFSQDVKITFVNWQHFKNYKLIIATNNVNAYEFECFVGKTNKKRFREGKHNFWPSLKRNIRKKCASVNANAIKFFISVFMK